MPKANEKPDVPVVDQAPTPEAPKVEQGAPDAPVVDQANNDKPKPHESKKQEGTNVIVNKNRAGATVFACTGKPVVFNKDGEAEVSKEDFDYLVTVPGYDAK